LIIFCQDGSDQTFLLSDVVVASELMVESSNRRSAAAVYDLMPALSLPPGTQNGDNKSCFMNSMISLLCEMAAVIPLESAILG
jgi:hypothetical protein